MIKYINNKITVSLLFIFSINLFTQIYGEIIDYSEPKIIEAKANINAVDEDGRTPLYLAVLKGDVEVAKSLIEAGADVNAVNENGQTPLYCAVLKGDFEVAKLLIEARADVNAIDKNALNPLYYARYDNDFEIAKLLIEAGADVNAIDYYQLYILMESFGKKYPKIAQLLINKKSDIKLLELFPIIIAYIKNYDNDNFKLLLFNAYRKWQTNEEFAYISIVILGLFETNENLLEILEMLV